MDVSDEKREQAQEGKRGEGERDGGEMQKRMGDKERKRRLSSEEKVVHVSNVLRMKHPAGCSAIRGVSLSSLFTS